MGRDRWFDHRITVTMTDDMVNDINRLLHPGEIRLDFIRGAIEMAIKQRKAAWAAGRDTASRPRSRGTAPPTG
jgi:metal-responsive CopG/Arc/MetJ family transcriptional regulator